MSVSDIEHLLEAIKSAALEPEYWDRVQQELISYAGVLDARLGMTHHDRNNTVWTRSTISGVDEMMREIGSKSEPVLYTAANPYWRMFSDYDFIDEKGIDASPYYNRDAEFGLRYRLALRLIDHPTITRAITLLWGKEKGPASREDFQLINRVADQLRLSAHVSLSLGSDLTAEKQLLENLANSNAAALVVEMSSRIVIANGLVENLFNEKDGICTQKGCLSLEKTDQDVQLQDLILHAGGASKRELEKGGGVLAVERKSGRAPYIAIVSPLPRKHQFLGDDIGMALVVIHDTTQSPQVDEGIFTQGLGMTSAEADVAHHFLQGKSLEDIARQRGVSLHTVRQQLKDILKKTHTHRQAELAVKLAALSRY